MTKVFCIGNGESRKGFDLNTLRPHGKIYGCNALYRDFIPDALISVDHGMMHEIYHSGYCFKNKTWFRDWTRIPEFMYNDLVNAGLSKVDIAEENKWHVKKENARTDEQEFVMHGANLSGPVTILHNDKTRTQKTINSNQLFISWVKNKDNVHNLIDIMPDNIDLGWSAGPTSGYVAVEVEKPKEIYLIGHDLTSNNDYVNNIYTNTKEYAIPESPKIPCDGWIQSWKLLFDMSINTQFYKVNTEINGDKPIDRFITEWNDCTNINYIDYKTLDKHLGI